MLQDFKHAVRVLLQAKGWTIVVLLSLALGIGANTALFSDLRETTSYPIYQTLRSANSTLVDIAASAPAGQLNVIVDGNAELASGYFVSGNYFGLLGINAKIGRTLTADDDNVSATPVVVLSYGFWMKRFGGDPNIVGKTLNANTRPLTIVGVTPREFTSILNLTDAGPDMWLPLALDPVLAPNVTSNVRLKDAANWWVQVIGRLKPGVTFEQVRGNLDGPFQAAARDGWSSYLASLSAEERSRSQNQSRKAVPHLEVDSAARGIYSVVPATIRSATILSVVVGLMLVIVCANVANLLLSRSASREKEISVRLSMGATRYRLVRQLLTESLLIAFIGGVLGLVIAYWSRQLLPFAQTAPLDWRVFAFTAGLCLLTGVAFGLVPALRATRVDLSGSMKETSRSVTRSRTLLSKSLLVTQVAISVVVLIGAGLFLRTLYNLRSVDVGFTTQNVVASSNCGP